MQTVRPWECLAFRFSGGEFSGGNIAVIESACDGFGAAEGFDKRHLLCFFSACWLARAFASRRTKGYASGCTTIGPEAFAVGLTCDHRLAPVRHAFAVFVGAACSLVWVYTAWTIGWAGAPIIWLKPEASLCFCGAACGRRRRNGFGTRRSRCSGRSAHACRAWALRCQRRSHRGDVLHCRR
jgi:hypothetical protein